MNIAFPLHFDAHGRTAAATDDDHIREMIKLVLFTNLGERVNRPDFGSGLLQMLFAANNPEVAAALHFTVQAALDRWLGDLIEVRRLEVAADDARLVVDITYAVRRTGAVVEASFERKIA
jgi:phage baseplate assembly protein W